MYPWLKGVHQSKLLITFLHLRRPENDDVSDFVCVYLCTSVFLSTRWITPKFTYVSKPWSRHIMTFLNQSDVPFLPQLLLKADSYFTTLLFLVLFYLCELCTPTPDDDDNDSDAVFVLLSGWGWRQMRESVQKERRRQWRRWQYLWCRSDKIFLAFVNTSYSLEQLHIDLDLITSTHSGNHTSGLDLICPSNPQLTLCSHTNVALQSRLWTVHLAVFIRSQQNAKQSNELR